MSHPVFISICIPAYKNTAYLARTLQSITEQTFRDFEVIITDDSPDDAVAVLVEQYKQELPIRYYRNSRALGSPGNWNAAIRLATGQWIKMMHDDDWFAGTDSLEQFAAATACAIAPFIYSGYIKVDEATGIHQTVLPRSVDINRLRHNPDYLIAFNVIGHPSTTLIKNLPGELYDEKLKWMVDVEYYHRQLRRGAFQAVQAPLICIGMNADQITKAVFRDPAVEIPENLYVLNKLGLSILRSLTVYDHFWRMIRNLRVSDRSIIELFRKDNVVPRVIYTMIRQQRLLPGALMKIGLISKTAMFLSWVWTGISRQRQGN